MGKLIIVVIVLVVLTTAAITLISFLRTPAGNVPVTRHAQQDQQAAPNNTINKAVSTYQENVRPTFLHVGDVLFSWIGDFYNSNKVRFVDLTWPIIATVMAGLILQRMRTA